MSRKRMLHAFRAARDAASYDERPVLPDSIDFQVHLSRNRRPQPFFLICQHDTMLAQLLGEGRIEFRGSNVLHHTLEPGDHVYIPAGTPSRLIPSGEAVQLRYKPQQPGLEGVAWFCDRCQGEIWRYEFDTASELPQEGYQHACARFNGDARLRTCGGCGWEHPRLDLSGIRWEEIAREIRLEAGAPPPATHASNGEAVPE
jgi:hypothetical protein